MTRANAAVVLAQGNVHDLVVDVLATPMLLHRLQQLGFGGWLEMKKRVPIATAMLALDPSQAGQVVPVANGIARCPAVADPNAAMILPNHFRMAVGVPGKVPGPFQGEHDFHAVAKPLVVFPAAARLSLLSAVLIQEG